jgi:hypothetical protein
MSPEMGRQALQYAAWIILVAVGLLCFLDRNSAEFIITAVSLMIGLVMAAVAWFVIRRSQR